MLSTGYCQDNVTLVDTQRIRSRLVEALEFRNVIQCERTRMMKKFDDMLSRYE